MVRAHKKDFMEELREWIKGEVQEKRSEGRDDRSVLLRTSAAVKCAREGMAHERRMVL